MKRGTPDHPKMKRLCSILCKPNYVGVGILEAMWHVVARYTPDGAIGKLANSEIARAIDWRGDPDNLVNALVASGWLDKCPCHRLYVHDWQDHADQTVGRVLKNRGLEFVKHDASTMLAYAKTVLVPSQHETSQPLTLSLPKPEPLDSETKPVSESPSNIPKATDNGSRPKRNPSPETIEKREKQKLQQESWFGEFRELFTWKWEGEDGARKIFSWKVKTLEVWELIRAAVIEQTPEQLAREPNFRTCPAKWLLDGKWKDKKPAPGCSVSKPARPVTFSEAKQARTEALFDEQMQYEMERAK